MRDNFPAIVVANRSHGEHGAVVRFLTSERGIASGFVAGARGRDLRPVLIPGNDVTVALNDRGDGRLASARVELARSRGPWMAEPLASAAIGWACALTTTVLPEQQPYPGLFEGLEALLEAICHAPSARGWARVLLAYEELLMRDLGYGGAQLVDVGDTWPEVLTALERSGRKLSARLLADRGRDVMAARAILIARLKRIEG